MGHKFIIILLMLVGHHCSPQGTSDDSAVKAIGTDLPDDGSAEPTIHLYWSRNGTIYRGRCADRSDILRSNCTDAIKSMNYIQFKETLDGGLSETIRILTEESRRIQQAISRINAQIDPIIRELNRLERERGSLSGELEQLRADLRRFQTFLAEYNDQLRMIDEALRNISDRDIERQRLIVLARIAEYQTRLTNIDSRIRGISRSLRGINEQIDQLQVKLVRLNTRLSNLQTELVSVNDRLRRAHDDFSVYQDTLWRLNDGIIYHVLSENVILRRQRQFVRRFDEIFAAL